MNTANELRNELAKVFEELRSGTIKPKEAAELANLAGKMIASAKVQIEYALMRKQEPTISFLESFDSDDRQ